MIPFGVYIPVPTEASHLVAHTHNHFECGIAACKLSFTQPITISYNKEY